MSVRVEPRTHFGKRLRELRTARGWVYEQVLDQPDAMFSRAYLVQLEVGSRLPTREAIVAMALTYELDTRETVELTLLAVADRVQALP